MADLHSTDPVAALLQRPKTIFDYLDTIELWMSHARRLAMLADGSYPVFPGLALRDGQRLADKLRAVLDEIEATQVDPRSVLRQV
jgi:hypothetical protein